MIELKHISRIYKLGQNTLKALDDVSMTFQDAEFVAILGPSGSGKTTLLNVIGGLDFEHTGEIIIDGRSTAKYKSKDWDAYRNHYVGFIFQSYNLIPHQSILSNVELALTLGGVGREGRRDRARVALEHVGLAEHVNKKPNQLSGGQMQRVAIARALVNDPKMVLADEPTGALDTETGIQVMELLRDLSRERCVIMVTHNPELAYAYATRIIKVKDGHIISDEPNNSVDVKTQALMAAPVSTSGEQETPESKQSNDVKLKSGMSFLTALSLSLNNLMTKKARTILTAFAGSIGIMGIAAILALSNGVNNYIKKTQEGALSSYPLILTRESIDYGLAQAQHSETVDTDTDSEAVEGEIKQTKDMSAQSLSAAININDLGSFKTYLDSGDAGIADDVNAISYSYEITPEVFLPTTETEVRQVYPSAQTASMKSAFAAAMPFKTSTTFSELPSSTELLESQVKVLAGRLPENAHEAILVLDKDGNISDSTLMALGFYKQPKVEVQEGQTQDEAAIQALKDFEHKPFTFDDALSMHFKVLSSADMYQRSEATESWTDMSQDENYLRPLVDAGIDLQIVGVVKPATDASSSFVSSGVAYMPALTQELIERASQTQIVQDQLAHSDVDVFTGKSFASLQEGEGQKLNLEDIFSIDGEALTAAFSPDENLIKKAQAAMNFDPSTLMDLMSKDDLSKLIDPNKLQIDPALIASVINEKSIANIMSTAPEPSFEQMFPSNLGESLSDEARERLEGEFDKLSKGFAAWLIAEGKIEEGTQPNYSALVEEYLATDGAKAILKEMQETSGKDIAGVYMSGFKAYLSDTFAPYVATQLQALLTKAMDVASQAVAAQLAEQMSSVATSMGQNISVALAAQMSDSMGAMVELMSKGFSPDPEAFQKAIKINATQSDLMSLFNNFSSGTVSYEDNLRKLGYADAAKPTSISIYPKDFKAKDHVIAAIEAYNERMRAEGKDAQVITYNDIAGILMDSVSTIINMISLVLIAFVSISLVVSSIMIGIITYISVLERSKEIGILRAMGASKGNIANIFNAETVIEGLMSGVFACAVVYLVSVPVNAYVEEWKGIDHILSLSPAAALVLIAISVGLNLLAGWIPSRKASRRDPVIALRSE